MRSPVPNHPSPLAGEGPGVRGLRIKDPRVRNRNESCARTVGALVKQSRGALDPSPRDYVATLSRKGRGFRSHSQLLILTAECGGVAFADWFDDFLEKIIDLFRGAADEFSGVKGGAEVDLRE